MMILFFLCLIIIAYNTYTLYSILTNLPGLPSPLFGGDYYYQLGAINHVYYGGDVLSSSSMLKLPPGYMPVYSLIVAILGKLINLPPLEAMKVTSILLYPLSFILYYFLFKKVTKYPEFFALLTIVPITFPIFHPILKYTEFFIGIFLPVYLFVFLDYIKSPSPSLLVNLSLLLVLGFWTHPVLTAGLTILLIAFEILYGKFLNLIIPLIFLTVGTLPYWLHYLDLPITPVDRIHFDLPDYSNPEVIFLFLSEIPKKLTRHYNPVTILALLPLFLFPYWKDEGKKLVLLSILLIFLSLAPDLFINFNLAPTYQLYTVFILLLLASAQTFDKIPMPLKSWLLIAASIYIFAYSYTNLTKFNEESKKYLLDPIISEASEWIKQHTNINDVILSNKELSFAINALTGRKLVVNRWAHQNVPFYDISQRDLAAAITLYSENPAPYLKKYNVSYVYWDIRWPSLEFQNGYPIDPLMVFDTTNNKKILEKNNIKYIATKYWVDPSRIGLWYIKTFDVLIISSENYNSPLPWKNLQEYLEPVWEKRINGTLIAALFRVKY